MAAPISFTLTGVGDQIAAAVAESLKHLQIDDKSPSASSIGEEVGKSVATALKSALSEIKKPALDASYLREQILANANEILFLYNGPAKHAIKGFNLTVSGAGDQIEAALVAKGESKHEIIRHVSDSMVMFQGSSRGSDFEALLALHDVMKLFMMKARECCLLNSRNHDYGFHDFKQLLS